MKLANVYPVIAVIVISVCAATFIHFIFVPEFKQPKLPDIRVSVSRGNPEEDKLGEMTVTTHNRWGKNRVVVFHDYGFNGKNYCFDGILDAVDDPEGLKYGHTDRKTWEERFSEVLKEYITGKRPKFTEPSQ